MIRGYDGMTLPIRDYGDRALLVQCGSIDEVLALAGAVRDANLPDGAEVVPGARTVLVALADPGHQAPARGLLAELLAGRDAHPGPAVESDVAAVTIDVVYDGPDLPDLAAQLQMSVAELVAAHTGTAWRVGFCGFSPGFAYLVGGDARLSAVPRRAEPRARVPAGSVALAGEFSGVYPRESPGGWQLIGRTDLVLWDVRRSQPALLAPGDRVRFRAAT